MIRPSLLVALVLGFSTAGLAADLPIPPTPPARPPRDEAAPVPNPNVRQPVEPSSSDIKVRPDVFTAKRPDPSMGFAPGSRYQPADERNPLQTPGVRLTVPLR